MPLLGGLVPARHVLQDWKSSKTTPHWAGPDAKVEGNMKLQGEWMLIVYLLLLLFLVVVAVDVVNYY